MKKRHYIIGGIVFVMIILWFFVLIGPTLEKGVKIRLDLQTANQQFQDFENIVMSAPEFYKTHEKIRLQKEHLASQLYSKENLLSLFKELEDRAAKHNLKVIEFTPSVEELLIMNRLVLDGDNPQTLNIVVTLSGTLQDFGDFLKGVESQNFYQGVDMCRISNSVDGQKNSNMIFGFKAVLGTLGKI